MKTQAQRTPDLPNNDFPLIQSSYSEDFSNFNSFPSMCFENIFFDDTGKMWLKACGSGIQSDIHLFQFDGYNFKLQEGEMAKMDLSSIIVDIQKGKNIIGLSTASENYHVFKYNLQEDILDTVRVNHNEELSHLVVNDNDEIFVLTIAGKFLKIYQCTDENSLLIKNELDQDNQSNWEVLHFDQKFIWRVSKSKLVLERIDWHSGVIQTTSIQDIIDSNNGSLNHVTLLLKQHKSHYYLSVTNTMYPDNSKLYNLNNVELTLSPVDFDYPVFSYFSITSDKKGSVLYLFTSPKKEHYAILKKENGQFFNYSPLFEKNKGFRVDFVRSDDFTIELFGCSERGLFVDKVKFDNHIKGYLENESIRSIIELDKNKLLIATQDQARYLFDMDSKSLSTVPSVFNGYNPYKIFIEEENSIWFSKQNTIINYNIDTGTQEEYFIDSISASLFVLSNDEKIYFRNDYLDLYELDLKTKKVIPFKVNGLPYRFKGFMHDMIYDDNGYIWIATNEGFLKIDVKNKSIENLSTKHPELSKRNLSLYQEKNGLIWLGTALNGIQIFDPATEEIKTINHINGLPNNTIASVTEDNQGYKWVGTYNGLSLLSPNGEVISNFYEEDGIINNEFNRYSKLLTQSGKIILGTIKGFNIIDPKSIKSELQDKNELKIYANSISYFNSSGEKQQINNYKGKPIILPSSRREITIEVATSNYFKSKENKFAYKLNHPDQGWIEIGNQPSIHLSNIEPGNHEILIKGSDNKGNWTKYPISIKVHAKEFFYKEIWFYILCLFAIACVGFLWITRLRSMVRKATKEIEEDKAIIEAQAKKLKELDKAKSRFFTNISHEFRTPLTIISGMLEQIKSKPDIWLEKGVQMIKHNTLNLLDLINQILDLRKLESNSLQLNLVQGNIISYLNYIIESYQVFAKGNGVKIHFMPDVEDVKMDYDPDKMLRIISNLLSNAVKFTPKEGDVYVQVGVENNNKDDGNSLLIRVKDTGVGIPQDELPQIFDRFYQVDDSITRKGEGTGIGLALTQELVKLMKGKIEVSSEIDKGSVFLIKLPVNNASPMIEAFPDPSSIGKEILHETLEADMIFSSENKEENSSLPNLLIVEDNPDVVQFLIASLEDNYQLQIARNGQEGIDKALEQVPDLIISDVMMPEKDGYELCDTLKRDERTSHIPIILLTAKADVDAKISGLEKGADAYLTKPFNQKELLVRLEKLFELRQKLQARYNSIKTDEKVSDVEDVFIQKVRGAVEKNIDDADFGIAQLCRAIGLQRAQLHNKLKALTGLSTSIYIRSIRLKKAKHLLKTTDLNVSEVAYDVGFKDPKYFSRLYIEAFNEQPSQTRK